MFRSPKLLHKLFPARIWGISVSDKSLFLTFDDGPIPEVTPWILDYLKEQQIVATFFCVGENVLRHPEIYKRILDDGHAVGNHTMKHLNGMKENRRRYLQSIIETEKIVDSKLFRPPYGRMNRKLDKILQKRFKIIMWTWLSKDYDATVSNVQIIEASLKIEAGDILVFHDNVKTMHRLQQLLPPIIERLKSEGFRFEKLH